MTIEIITEHSVKSNKTKTEQRFVNKIKEVSINKNGMDLTSFILKKTIKQTLDSKWYLEGINLYLKNNDWNSKFKLCQT